MLIKNYRLRLKENGHLITPPVYYNNGYIYQEKIDVEKRILDPSEYTLTLEIEEG